MQGRMEGGRGDAFGQIRRVENSDTHATLSLGNAPQEN